MRLLAILWCLLASAFCFSNDRDRVGPDGAPLRGKELWKTELKKSMRHLPGGDPPSITEINMRSGLDEVLVEGDIVMTPDEARHYFGVDSEGRRSKRQAFQKKGEFPRSLWSNGMYYGFDKNLNKKMRDLVHAAIKFWQENTCISFHEAKTKQEVARAPVKPVVLFYHGVGCSSHVGRYPDVMNATMQGISLQADGCDKATHEIAHALGFIHEHNRWDRNEYIFVDFNGITADGAVEFHKVNKTENDNYGKQYDFGGVMHYAATDGAKVPDANTMLSYNPDYQMTIGNFIGPVYGDVYEMNMLYSCYDRCNNSGTVCKNEGKPNPNNCSVCQCPSGFGGDDCSQREASTHGLTCGDTLVASETWKTLKSTGVIGSGYPNFDRYNASDPYRCTWHITAPKGKVIAYRVIFVGALNTTVGDKHNKHCRSKCHSGGLKIKGLEKTWTPEGMRFCCKNQANKTMTTASNLLVIEAYNHVYYTDFAVKYRIKPSAPTTTPRVPSSGCPAGYDISSSSGTQCYSVNVEPKTYLEASLSCLRSNGSISLSQAADDKTMLKDIFIKEAKSSGVSRYWSGFKDGKCGIYDISLNTYTYTNCTDLSKKAGYICQFPPKPQ
uniref:Metalloendopeptidase n=1 Tax=Steinernema glaseri TaxID=37863 RepID=A0A1I8AFQ5_9BILA